MKKIITISTDNKNGHYDIRDEVESIIKISKIKTEIASVYVKMTAREAAVR
jgi:thiamine phosphate synthase YjbQ (UPF0047 family)